LFAVENPDADGAAFVSLVSFLKANIFFVSAGIGESLKI
jgi:hypothetical protein